MTNLTRKLENMSNEEIHELIAVAQKELDSRDTPVEYVLQGKATYPCTYKQFQYLENFDNVEIQTTTSQVMKRMNVETMSKAIDKAKTGKKVVVR